MNIDITPSELKDLIKLHEVEKKQVVKQYEKLEDSFLFSNQTYRKIDEQREKKMLDLAKRIYELDLRIVYLKRVLDDRVKRTKKVLNHIYGVNGVIFDLSLKDIIELTNEIDSNELD